MSRAADSTLDLPSLRQRALAQLDPNPGARTDLRRASTSEAMAVLHQLASSPATAGDALALLHELQVHQVEVDLQQEELRNSRIELENALMRQTALVERAPAGFMSIDAATVLEEINPAGARLLGAARDELLGRPLAGLLSASSADRLHGMLARAHDGLEPQTCELQLNSIAGPRGRLHAAADRDARTGHFLIVLMAAASPG